MIWGLTIKHEKHIIDDNSCSFQSYAFFLKVVIDY